MINKLFLTVVFISCGCLYAQQKDKKAALTDKASSHSAVNKHTPGKDADLFTAADGINREWKLKAIKPIHKKQYPPYRIIDSRYVSRSTILKSLNAVNEVKIRIMQNGLDNLGIEDFSLAYDSGNEYHMSNTYGIENISFPLYVKVTYRSWNTFHAVQFDVNYEFVIYSPGSWNVTLFN